MPSERKRGHEGSREATSPHRGAVRDDGGLDGATCSRRTAKYAPSIPRGLLAVPSVAFIGERKQYMWVDGERFDHSSHREPA